MSSLLHVINAQLQRSLEFIGAGFSPSTILSPSPAAADLVTPIIDTLSASLIKRDDATTPTSHNFLSNGDVTFGDVVFTGHEIYMIRISGLSSACCSILFGLLAIYFYLMINPRKRVFRQKLIMMLIGFDFLKALCLLIYPLVNLRHSEAGLNRAYVNAMGFFTALGIEGADFMILWFAIHIALLIFRPNRTSKESGNIEGGLYFVRYYIYLVTILLPVILACLGFINDEGYQPDISYSYLTVSPVWYRVVLSWVPRYCIVVVVVCIYGYVYYHVLKEYKKVSGSMDIINPDQRRSMSDVWGETWWYKVFKLLLILVFPDVQINAKLHGQGLTTEADLQNLEKLRIDDLENNMEFLQKNTNHLHTLMEDESSSSSYNNVYSNDDSNGVSPEERIKNIQLEVGLDVQRSLHKEAMEKFQLRRIQILSQMKVIFIYPLSYILLWLFPFIGQCMQFHWGQTYYKLVWLNCTSAFFQAFNCSIDTIVFLIREQPWNLTIEKTDPKLGLVESYPKWRQYAHDLFLPGYTLPETIHESTNRLNREREELERQLNEQNAQQIRALNQGSTNPDTSQSSYTLSAGTGLSDPAKQKLKSSPNYTSTPEADLTHDFNRYTEEDDDDVELSLSEILGPPGGAPNVYYQSRSISTNNGPLNNNSINSHTVGNDLSSASANSRRNSKVSWSGPQNANTDPNNSTNNINNNNNNNTGTGTGIPASIKTRKSSQYSTNSSSSHNESDSEINNSTAQAIVSGHQYTLPGIQEDTYSQSKSNNNNNGLKSVLQDWQFKRKTSGQQPRLNSVANSHSSSHRSGKRVDSIEPFAMAPPLNQYTDLSSTTNMNNGIANNNSRPSKEDINEEADEEDDGEIDIMDFLKFGK